MKILFMTIAIILLAAGMGFGNEFSGKVTDLTGNPVFRARIILVEPGIVGQTDYNGKFNVNVADITRFTLIIDAPGYEKPMVEVDLTQIEMPLGIALSPAIYRIDDIVVTACRSNELAFYQPRYIVTVDRKDIDFFNPVTTSEILRQQTAVEVQKTTHGDGSVMIRGLTGQEVLIMTDGIRLNNSTIRSGPSPYLNTIPSVGISRVETVMGPSSVIYGSDALGGAINIISDPFNSLASIALVSTYSSADEAYWLAGNTVYRHDKDFIAVGFERRDIGDLTGGGDIGKQSPTGWTDFGLNVISRYALSDRLSLQSGFQAFNGDDIPRYDKYESAQNDIYYYDPRDRYLGYLRLNDNEGAYGFDLISSTLSFQRQNEGNRYRKTGSDKTTFEELGVSTFHFDLIGSKNWSASSITTLGTDLYYDTIDSWRQLRYPDHVEIADPSIPDGSSYLASGVFIQHQMSFKSRWQFRPGLRYSLFKAKSDLYAPYDKLDDYYSDISFSLGTIYELSQSINLVANLSRGFRAPNLDDLTAFKTSNQGREVPSPEISAEHSSQLDLGIKWDAPRFYGEFHIWGSILTDFINRRAGTYNGLNFWDENSNGIQDVGEENILIKVNSDRYYMKGAELSTEYRFDNNWSVKLGTSYVRGENANTGEPMTKIPPLMGIIALNYSGDFIHRAELYANMASRQDRLSDLDKTDTRINPIGTPSWIILSSRVKFNLTENIQPILGVENIFDKAYKRHASGVYSPGRNLVMSLQISM